MTTVLHVSDLHFGRPALPDQIDAIEELVQSERYGVVAISGTVSPRARAGEFLSSLHFLPGPHRGTRPIIAHRTHRIACVSGRVPEPGFTHPHTQVVRSRPGGKVAGRNGCAKHYLRFNRRNQNRDELSDSAKSGPN